MASKWLAAFRETDEAADFCSAPRAVSVNSANSAPPHPEPHPFGTNGAIGTGKRAGKGEGYSGSSPAQQDALQERAALIESDGGVPYRSAELTPPPDWWADEFEERAAIREHLGGYTREEAERLAWGELENRWHRLHGERVPPELCAGCRRPIGNAPAMEQIDGNRAHDAPGHDCLIRYGERWRGRATQGLVSMGLKAPHTAAGSVL